ncbi:hypothetical protein [Streptomyces sp. JH34]|uniref:hypothetical protein n=1 Tax=Streptomyces sp. JH34 TaxID=2793633 RepID=UPI0023F7B9D0|nr:hypothetical protein [Streptomyces sp. JH34]MDF6022452.1 hypothetical protein [Streptomyces sp. JH34]
MRRRPDNVLLTADQVMVVDRPWAAGGTKWFDVLAMGPSMIMQSTRDTIDLLDEHLEPKVLVERTSSRS